MINLESVDSSEESKSDSKSSKKSNRTDMTEIPVAEIPKMISELQKKMKTSKKLVVKEENKIDKFMNPFAPKWIIEESPRIPYLVEDAQEKHKDLNVDLSFPEYIQELKRIKKKFALPRREKRSKIRIFCINYWKKNLEYYKVQEMQPGEHFLLNPRAPFDKLDSLDYEIMSDDLD